MAVEPGLFRRSWRSERGRVGWGGLLLLVLLVEVGGRLWPFSYGDLAPGPTALAPGWPHLMGTTTIGQDVLSWVSFTNDGTCVRIGKNMNLSGRFLSG